MKLNVTVLIGNEEVDMKVPVGDGNNTIKWLALAVSQRYSHMLASGRVRCRDSNIFSTSRKMSFLPGRVFSASTHLYPPDESINDHFHDNEGVRVELLSRVPVGGSGRADLSRWGDAAFLVSNHTRERQESALEEEYAMLEEEKEKRRRRVAQKREEEQTSKANFMREVIRSQLVDERKIAVELNDDITYVRENRFSCQLF